ncbi:MAG: hypothetical protein GC179_08760 [Anaerolineaceae bacterium]|nr:hypothetical protein [Anaerolineaceae bacterium]
MTNNDRFAKGNALLLQNRIEREGAYGEKRRSDMAAIQKQINELENSPVSSAKQAQDQMARAKALREQLDGMANFNELEAQQFNSSLQQKQADVFSQMQQSNLEAEASATLAIDSAWDKVVFNPTIGVPREMLSRQLGRLINGEGVTDANGNRSVSFQYGKSSTVYNAVQAPDGSIGFVMQSRGSDASQTGVGSVGGGE